MTGGMQAGTLACDATCRAHDRRRERVVKHCDAPVWPRVQSLHVPAAMLVPGLQQSTQALLPTAGWYLFTAHFLHADRPWLSVYWPLGQAFWDVLPVPAA